MKRNYNIENKIKVFNQLNKTASSHSRDVQGSKNCHSRKNSFDRIQLDFEGSNAVKSIRNNIYRGLGRNKKFKTRVKLTKRTNLKKKSSKSKEKLIKQK